MFWIVSIGHGSTTPQVLPYCGGVSRRPQCNHNQDASTYLVANAVVRLAVASVVAIIVLQESRVPDPSGLAAGGRDTHAAGGLGENLSKNESVVDVVLIGNVVDGIVLRWSQLKS